MTRAWTVMTKDLRMGPRSPLFLFAIILPVALTFLIVGVFGSLFAPSPRLGIVDEGDSAIVATASDLDGIEVTTVTSVATLREMVEANDLDAGLVLSEGFDAALASGQRPELNFYVGGESLASNRIILEVTALDLVRGATGAEAPVDVEVLTLGDAEAVNLPALTAAERFTAVQTGDVDLLLTEVVLPGMRGPKLVERMRARLPDLRVVYISGYAAEELDHLDVSAQHVGYLPKPFKTRALLGKVREALGYPAS